MMLLVLTEANGVSTQLSIGADAIALNMLEFFQNEIGLEVTIDQITKPIVVSEQEATRADYLIQEWRDYSKAIFVVK